MTQHIRNQIILQRAISKRLRYYGSYSKLGKALGISKTYLYNLHHGIRTNPSERILNKLRLHKHIVYRMY